MAFSKVDKGISFCLAGLLLLIGMGIGYLKWKNAFRPTSPVWTTPLQHSITRQSLADIETIFNITVPPNATRVRMLMSADVPDVSIAIKIELGQSIDPAKLFGAGWSKASPSHNNAVFNAVVSGVPEFMLAGWWTLTPRASTDVVWIFESRDRNNEVDAVIRQEANGSSIYIAKDTIINNLPRGFYQRNQQHQVETGFVGQGGHWAGEWP